LVELGAAMMVASTMVPERSNSRRPSSRPVIELKIASVSPCCSSRGEAQNRTRLVTWFGFGVMRLDLLDQPRPWNHRIHFAQKPLAPGHPFPFQASHANVR
jgi:hypothetical protein